MKVDSAFVQALETDPNSAAAKQIEKTGTDADWSEQLRENSENLKRQEGLKTREMNAQREVTQMKESMQVLDDRMDAIQKGIKELDQREEALFKKGMLPGNPEIMNELDIEREELSKLHEKSFDSFHKVMRNFNKLLDHFSDLFDKPHTQAN
jgi:predicted RNase H-like nuclease (RuvC/YqgF family)